MADAPGGEQQAALPVAEGSELGDHRQAEVVGVGGVDAAHQGVDEALVDLVAEPATDQPPDRVAGVGAGRQQWLDCRPQLAADADQPAPRQRADASRHPQHHSVGQVVETVVPHEGARRCRGSELFAETDPLGEGGAVGDSGEEGIGALVDCRATGEG